MAEETSDKSPDLSAKPNSYDARKWTTLTLTRWILVLLAVALIDSTIILLQLAKLWYAIIFTGVVLFIVIALWKLPKWQLRAWADRLDSSIKIEPKDFIKAENDARTTLAQIIGGILVLISLFFTAENLRNSQETLRVSQEGQITERFTKAIDQLGSDKPDIAVGGVYALGRIARDSERDHWPIMEILTAYVRRVAPRTWNTEVLGNAANLFQVPGTELLIELAPNNIQAVMDVLKGRELEYETLRSGYLRLDATKLEAVNLHKAYLRKASFIASSLKAADLGEADLSETRFSNSDLSAANCDKAKFQKADFTRAILFHTSLIAAYAEEADFTNADLREADFTSANLSRADLRGAQLNKTNFKRAILNGARLDGVDLRNAIGLVREQIDSAVTNDQTQLPADFHQPIK